MTDEAVEQMILDNLSKPLEVILGENPEVKYDETLIRAVCGERVFSNQTERLSELGPVPTILDFLKLFRQESSQQEFMAFYVVRWKRQQSISMFRVPQDVCLFETSDGDLM